MTKQAQPHSASTTGGLAGQPSLPSNPKYSIELHGIPAAPGLAIGTAFVLPAAHALPQDSQTIPLKSVAAEKARLVAACRAVSDAPSSEFAQSLGVGAIVSEVEKSGMTLIGLPFCFSAVSAVKASLAAVIENSPNHMKSDLVAIQNKLISAIHGGNPYMQPLPSGTIVVAEELSAVTLGGLTPATSIVGLVAHKGGVRDHAAIVARDRGWPATFRVQGEIQSVKSGDTLAVDGTTGRVVVNPTPDQLRELFRIQEIRRLENELRPVPSRIVHTLDGRKVFLAASVDSVEGLCQLKEAFPDVRDRRIGLFRSEFELLKHRAAGQKQLINDEEGQVDLYKKVLEVSGGRRVTIRTVDWSPGDKTDSDNSSKNPALGHRGVRFSLKHPEQFRVQLRALLRASKEGEISIMFPMVHDAEQVNDLVLQLEIAEIELAKRGIILGSKRPTIGVMVEVPSAVREIDKIARKVDFISIGSSDLTQYTLAFQRDPSADTDATDEQTFAPHHPAVLSKIASVIEHCQDEKVLVSVCGEMASDSMYVPLLLGAGLQIFSVAPRGARAVHDAIAHSTYAECRDLVQSVISSEGPFAALRLLSAFQKRHQSERP